MSTNGFFGTIQGPFNANEQILTKIQQNAIRQIQYLSKIAIQDTSDFDLNLNFPFIMVKINNKDFQLGKTGILQLEDVQITSIKFNQDVGQNINITYQYK